MTTVLHTYSIFSLSVNYGEYNIGLHPKSDFHNRHAIVLQLDQAVGDRMLEHAINVQQTVPISKLMDQSDFKFEYRGRGYENDPLKILIEFRKVV